MKQIKEYSLLGEIGLDDLIPKAFVHHFIRRDEDGNHEMPVVYKDHINAHGFGKDYINELRARKGYTFAKQLKEPMHKSKYVQAQINDIGLILRRNEFKISSLTSEFKQLNNAIDHNLKVSNQVMLKVDEFKEASSNTEKFLKDINTKVDYFTSRA